MNKLDKIKEELGNAQIHLEFCKDALNNYKEEENIIFVPKSIKIASSNDGSGSAYIINDVEQGLIKIFNAKSFSVSTCSDGNDNTGSNYKLVEVDKPVANKLYFVVQGDDLSYISYIHHYIITIDKDTYVYWDNNDKLKYSNSEWKHYYEVVRIDEE